MATKRAMVVRCKLCCKPSVAICVACDRYYCAHHFDEHRQTFAKYVNDAHKQSQSICECLAELQPIENELRSRIEEWERKTSDKVHCAANKAVNEFDTLIGKHRRRFEEESSMIISDTSTISDDKLILIEKLQSEYEHALTNICLVPHNDGELTLEVRAINLRNEEIPLQELIRTGPYQEGFFQPQSILGKRLTEAPFAETPVGSYWTTEGSDTHLLVQEFETNQLTLFDRHGKRGISMTWHYGTVIRDIQWHCQSRRFFILLDKNLIIFDPNTKYFQQINGVTPGQSNSFRRCTCLGDHLFISFWGSESTIELFQISSWRFQQRWLGPITCRANEMITCLRFNSKEQLALSIQDENNPNNRQFRIEIRDLALNTLHSCMLHTDIGIFSRMAALPDGCWAVVNVDGNHIFIVNEEGRLVDKVNYNQGTLRNIALIGEDIAVIRTTNKLLFYNVTFTRND